ncbi:unnamed protein product [Fraxinus pennsylvanica]|uniref:Polygalacturonase n=1 Tax=Fraxinus pennsylvanica TaxID=56036 RepID=A0AAD2ALR6_9LAMI|nr:unnamed protein product [Fraxinus pennsylvanica]
MALSSGFGIVLTLFLFFRVSEANGISLPPKFFNVLNYGAVADGKTDNSQEFLKAWKSACEYGGRSRVLVPLGTFMLGSVTFQGVCKGSMEFLIKGTLMAATNSSNFFTNTWIGFQYLNDLTVEGGGSLDGQGSAAWGFNDCVENSQCPSLPAGQSISGVQIKNVTFRNIWGTSSSKVAVNLDCSKRVPCRKIEFVDKKLVHNGAEGPATSQCANVIDSSYAKQMPPGCV